MDLLWLLSVVILIVGVGLSAWGMVRGYNSFFDSFFDDLNEEDDDE